jgi:hypothetical protein
MSGKRQPGISINEALERLWSDPEWVARHKAAERRRRETLEASRLAQRELLEELREVGIRVNSVWDLVNTSARYDAALPILLKHLDKNYPDCVKAGIARSLGRRWARDVAWDYVLAAYRSEPSKRGSWTKDGLAVAIECMARPSDLDVLIDLLLDPRHGSSRVFFVRPISRLRSPRAAEALRSMEVDPDLKKEIGMVLLAKAKREARRASKV